MSIPYIFLSSWLPVCQKLSNLLKFDEVPTKTSSVIFWHTLHNNTSFSDTFRTTFGLKRPYSTMWNVSTVFKMCTTALLTMADETHMLWSLNVGVFYTDLWSNCTKWVRRNKEAKVSNHKNYIQQSSAVTVSKVTLYRLFFIA